MFAPFVAQVGTRWHLYYSGGPDTKPAYLAYQLGLATSSSPKGPWTKHGTPLLPLGAVDNFRATSGAEVTAGGAKPSPVSVGSALLGIVEDLRGFYADQRNDFRMANMCKQTLDMLRAREELSRQQLAALPHGTTRL